MNLELKESMSHWIVSLFRQLCHIWWRMMMTNSKNSSNLHFVHRMCEVTSFYQDEILMFTTNPSTGERSSKNFQPIQCLWNVSYYIGTLLTHLLTNVALITKDWGDGQNNVLQLKWTTLICTNPSIFFVLFPLDTINTTKYGVVQLMLI